jgi:hypothetical protein
MGGGDNTATTQQQHSNNTKPSQWLHLTYSLVCETNYDTKHRRRFILPEYEYEENQEREEDGDVVHCPQHDEQLTAQVGHETH